MKRAHITHGFTLVELMVTLSIVALLAAIAYPTYHQYLLKGRRAEGRAALMSVLQQQERYYTQYGKYFWDIDGASPFKTHSGDNLGNSAYTIANVLCDPSLSRQECVEIRATPIAPDPDAGMLTIKSVGPIKSCDGNKKEVCWR